MAPSAAIIKKKLWRGAKKTRRARSAGASKPTASSSTGRARRRRRASSAPGARKWWKAKHSPTEVVKYFDPVRHLHDPLPVPNTLGNFVEQTAMHRFQIQSRYSPLLILQWTPTRMCVMKSWETETKLEVFETLKQDPKAVFTRPNRLSLRIRNVSKADNIQGVVHALTVPEPVHVQLDAANPPKLIAATRDALVKGLEKDPRTKTFSAHSLSRTHTFVTPPAHMNNISSWYEFKPLYVVDGNEQFFDHGKQEENNKALAEGVRAPLCTALIYFPAVNDTVAASQTYEITAHIQNSVQYGADSVMNSHSQPATPGNTTLFAGAAQAATGQGAFFAGSAGPSAAPTTPAPRGPSYAPSTPPPPPAPGGGSTPPPPAKRSHLSASSSSSSQPPVITQPQQSTQPPVVPQPLQSTQPPVVPAPMQTDTQPPVTGVRSSNTPPPSAKRSKPDPVWQGPLATGHWVGQMPTSSQHFIIHTPRQQPQSRGTKRPREKPPKPTVSASRKKLQQQVKRYQRQHAGVRASSTQARGTKRGREQHRGIKRKAPISQTDREDRARRRKQSQG